MAVAMARRSFSGSLSWTKAAREARSVSAQESFLV